MRRDAVLDNFPVYTTDEDVRDADDLDADLDAHLLGDDVREWWTDAQGRTRYGAALLHDDGTFSYGA